METKNFVFINSDSLKFCSPKLKKEVFFEEKAVRNLNPTIIALIIRESLDELELSDRNIVLVLGSEYLQCSEKITSHVKKTPNQEFSVNNTKIHVLKTSSVMDDFIISRQTRFICDGKTVNNFEALPLLQKYFETRLYTEFDYSFISGLLESLSKNDIEVNSIMPFEFLISAQAGRQDILNKQIFLSYRNKETIATVCENGVVVKNIAYAFGMHKVVEDVSNHFNVSFITANKLINMYGFVFLPKNYLNYVIDVPIYAKVYQHIALTDLTYCIRESLKDIFNGILSNLSAKISDFEFSSNFICETSLNVNGMGELLGLILNRDLEFTLFKDYEYANLLNTYNSLIEVDIESLKMSIKPEIIIPIENHDQPAFMDKLTNLFNSRIKPFLLEPEV